MANSDPIHEYLQSIVDTTDKMGKYLTGHESDHAFIATFNAASTNFPEGAPQSKNVEDRRNNSPIQDYFLNTMTNIKSRLGIDKTVPPEQGAKVAEALGVTPVSAERVQEIAKNAKQTEFYQQAYNHLPNSVDK